MRRVVVPVSPPHDPTRIVSSCPALAGICSTDSRSTALSSLHAISGPAQAPSSTESTGSNDDPTVWIANVPSNGAFHRIEVSGVLDDSQELANSSLAEVVSTTISVGSIASSTRSGHAASGGGGPSSTTPSSSSSSSPSSPPSSSPDGSIGSTSVMTRSTQPLLVAAHTQAHAIHFVESLAM